MDNVEFTIGVVVFNGNKVLLVENIKGSRHKTGVFGLPSGRIDTGETPAQAAKREFEEETGLTTAQENLSEFANNHYTATIEQKDKSRTFDWTVFLCKAYSGELKMSQETNPVWVDVADLNNYELLPNVKNAVMAASYHLKALLQN